MVNSSENGKFLAELLQTALLFKWKYFLASLMKSHKVSEFPVF